MQEDYVLIAAFINGSSASFEELVRRYKGYVFAIILKIISEHTEVENVAQETFLQAFRSIPKDKPENFKAWIGTIAMRKAIDRRRKIASTKQEIYDGSVDEPEACAAIAGDDVESIVISKEQASAVRKTVAALPEPYSQAIADFYFLGKTIEQIAAENDVAKRTVESWLYRGRKMFKERYGGGQDALFK